MILVTHALVGAGIASLIPDRPIGAFLAGFVSHFALDAIPHWDYPLRSLFKGTRPRLDSGFFADIALIAIDVVAGLVLATFLFANSATWMAVVLGTLGAIAPDALQFAHQLFPVGALLRLQQFHNSIHTRQKLGNLVGVSTQLAFGVVIVQLFRFVESGALGGLVH